MNPKQGLKIKAFKGAGTAAARADKELWRLADYLIRLAALESFLLVDHAVVRPSLLPSMLVARSADRLFLYRHATGLASVSRSFHPGLSRLGPSPSDG